MKLRERIGRALLRSSTLNFLSPAGWENVFYSKSKSGMNVTADTAMNLSAVFACVRRSTETLSTLPVHVFRKTKSSREEIDHPVSELLSRKPNPEMPANVFREVLQGHIELRGVAYAEIVRNGSGIPVELWPIHPDHMTPERKGRDLIYRYLPTNYEFNPRDILHFRGLGSSGLDHYSIISLARESMGMALAAQEYGSRFFAQGTNMGGFLKKPGVLKQEAFDRLKEQMDQQYAGLQGSHKLIILEDGLEYQKVGLTNEDAQFLDSRKFQVSEIARWFGMQPHMIGDLEKATFSNIEQQSIEAVIYTWRPRAVRIEQEINMKLLGPNEYVKFSLEGLLRGDIKSRFEAYKIAGENGWMNADEIRAMEDMNPQPDGLGKVFLYPMNMANKENLLLPPADQDPGQRSSWAKYEGLLRRHADPQMFRSAALAMIPELREEFPGFNEDEYITHCNRIMKLLDKRAVNGIDIDTEIIRMRNAFRYAAMEVFGVKEVMWRSDPSCPHCQHLDGKKVLIGQPFENNVRHAPLVPGCNCSIERG